MFNNNISIPVSPLTNTYINKLNKIHNEPDYSLISLAVALIKPRVKEFTGMTGFFKFYACTDDIINDIVETNKSRSNNENKDLPGFYYCISNYETKGKESLVNAAKEMGLTELSTVENFVQQQLSISNYCAFINSENNSAFVVVNASTMSLYHLSISFISLLYPSLFKDNPLTKNEMEAVKGLTNKSSTNFIERVSALLQYMKQDLMREELSACFKGFRQGRIDQCKREMEEADYRVDQALEQYRTRVDQYNDIVIRYEGLCAINSDDQNEEEAETIEYISSCKQINNVNYSNGVLSFCADTLLTNFDVSKWRNAVRRNGIYDNYRVPDDSVFKSRTNRMRLFEAIFNIKPKLCVKVKGWIQLYPLRCDMTAPRGQLEAESMLKDCLSNPHFKIHGCPGRNKEQIIRCLRQGDVMSAIECSIAATGSVNIDETEYTFRPFLQEIITSKNKILQTINGEDMTPEEALLWLSKQVDEEPETTIPF